MAHWRRGVRVLKWLGAGLCVLIAAAFVVSLWWTFSYLRNSKGPPTTLFQGGLTLGFLDHDLANNVPLNGLYAMRYDGEFRVDWWPWRTPCNYYYGYAPPVSGLVVRLPLWIPFLAILLPTLLLWFLDRRRPAPGHCPRCNYNLTGNTTARCPECGAAIDARTSVSNCASLH